MNIGDGGDGRGPRLPTQDHVSRSMQSPWQDGKVSRDRLWKDPGRENDRHRPPGRRDHTLSTQAIPRVPRMITDPFLNFLTGGETKDVTLAKSPLSGASGNASPRGVHSMGFITWDCL